MLIELLRAIEFVNRQETKCNAMAQLTDMRFHIAFYGSNTILQGLVVTIKEARELGVLAEACGYAY
jgi:hypothetical protein